LDVDLLVRDRLKKRRFADVGESHDADRECHIDVDRLLN
jgi:hypothetical protein